MEKALDILIMAAGLGTRMKSNRAKVLHEVDGRPLINPVVETALTLGPKSVCVIVGHQADEVKAAVTAEFPDERVCFALQENQLGTGDAINSTRELYSRSQGNIVVLTGDVPLITAETIRALVNKHDQDRAASTLLSVRLADPTGYGRVVRNKDGTFEKIVEQKDASDIEKQIDEINAGFYCFSPFKLYEALSRLSNQNAQGEFYLTDIPGILKSDGEQIGVCTASDAAEVEGVNDRRQLAQMEKVIRRRTVERLMLESGVTFIDPKAVYISARASIGRDTVICPNVTIEGNTVIGDACTIRPGVRIANSIIGNGVEIKDNTYITDSTVGDDCSVGPMAHLRGHAVMADKAKVGNFVELKKTTLGKGSKASHLTYLGDATIGEKTNIGAGTITCNYDGVNKHATVIGDNVKIGSDTMLVAPITVGDGAVTGAGSVVTRDIAPNKLAVGAPARAIKTVTGDK